MTSIKLFFKNVSILFEALPHYFLEVYSNQYNKFKKNKSKFFRISKSPKTAMNLSFVCFMASIVAELIFLAIFFLLMFLVFWMYKIWLSGYPMKFYNKKYGINL